MSSPQPANSDESGLPRRSVATTPGDRTRQTSSSRHWSSALFEEAMRSVSGGEANVHGLLLASADGLVLASDTRKMQIETVAAMAAAAASIAAQFTEQADVGESRASMFEGTSGYVGVFPVEPGVLLVVFGQKDITMGLFNVAARGVLSRLQQAIVRQRMLALRAARRPAQTDGTEVDQPQQ